MKKLKESKLLLREDIQNEDLLFCACNPETPMRFTLWLTGALRD